MRGLAAGHQLTDALPPRCQLQSYEVIGNPPSISVPTHFAKVILTSRVPNGRSVTDAARDISIGAFVLPNAVIADEAPLSQFAVPGLSEVVSSVFCPSKAC